MYPPQFPSNIYNIYGVSVKQLKLPIFDVKCNLSAQEEDWRVGESESGSQVLSSQFYILTHYTTILAGPGRTVSFYNS